jgi:hydrogenase nickel incorporation protein HypA/HybF
MHEASLVAGLIRGVTEQLAERAIAGRVVAVHLRVGRLTAAVPESLELFFGALTPGTALEGARLVVEQVPVRCACRACGAEFAVRDTKFACDRCGSGDVSVVAGRELLVEAVEVE